MDINIDVNNGSEKILKKNKKKIKKKHRDLMMSVFSLSHVLKNVKCLALTHAQLVAQTCPTEDNTIFDITCHFER